MQEANTSIVLTYLCDVVTFSCEVYALYCCYTSSFASDTECTRCALETDRHRQKIV